MTDQDDLSPEEASAMRELAAGPEPPGSLENRAVERLRARGLIARRNRRGIPWLAAAAAAIALFAAGLYLGSRRPETRAAAALPRYVLFLYDAPDEAALSPAEMGKRVDEYRTWARGVREGGADIQGEKLAAESHRLGSGQGGSAEVLGGYFVVSAKDEKAALAIARSCPHLKHGGTIELRRIEET